MGRTPFDNTVEHMEHIHTASDLTNERLISLISSLESINITLQNIRDAIASPPEP